MQWQFTLPKNAEILIYDGEGSHHLIRILQLNNLEILHIRREKINLPILLFSMVKKIINPHQTWGTWYEDCYINQVKPTLIITFIDNQPRFHLLAIRHPHIKTLFIQNGWRGGKWDIFQTQFKNPINSSIKRFVNHMCTFGTMIGNEYNKYIKGKTNAIGSIISNEYPINNANKIKQIAYISIYSILEEPVLKAVELVLHTLLKYSLQHKIPLIIIGRTSNLDEENYYRSILGEQPVFIKRSHIHSSYHHLDNSLVSVSIDSSLGYENVARGNRNAFFSILGHYTGVDEFNFGWPTNYPNQGSFWTNHPDPQIFTQILDHLFTIDDKTWQQELANIHYQQIMTYDAGNIKLKKILTEALSESC